MDRLSMMILKSNIPVKIYWLSWHDITSIVQNLLQTSRSIYERLSCFPKGTGHIKIIISLCKRKIFTLVSSEILEFEINKTSDILRRERLKILKSIAEEKIKIDERIEKRAKNFEKSGIQSFCLLYTSDAADE